MKLECNIIGPALKAAVIVMMIGVLQGCGGGGGSTAIPSSSISAPAGDTTANANSVHPGTTTAGCTDATYAPNFAGGISLYRWTHQPIRVRFLNSGAVVKNDGTTADLQQVALEGFQEWATATNNGIAVQVTTDSAQTDVTVHFGRLTAVPTANDVLGLESSTLYLDGALRSSDVLLNVWPEMTVANIESFRETAAHEFGHALGIGGHSDSSLDVMYAGHVLTSGKGLSARDVNTLRTAYCNQFTREAPAHPQGATRTVTIP